MDRNSEIQELSSADVEQVTGGLIITALAAHIAQCTVKDPKGGDTQGGQNDPAQMFQQIIQHLTQQ
jgi:hypothetical protein